MNFLIFPYIFLEVLGPLLRILGITVQVVSLGLELLDLLLELLDVSGLRAHGFVVVARLLLEDFQLSLRLLDLCLKQVNERVNLNFVRYLCGLGGLLSLRCFTVAVVHLSLHLLNSGLVLRNCPLELSDFLPEMER